MSKYRPIIKGCLIGLVLALYVACLPASAGAAELSYDRYAADYEQPIQKTSLLKRALLHWPVYPFELIRWPIDRVLYYIEDRRLDTKALWVYDQIKNHGVSPRVNVLDYDDIGAGVDVDFIRLIKQKHNYPDLVLKGWVNKRGFKQFNTGGTFGFERIGGTGLSFKNVFEYDRRLKEHFYGIGPDTSRGDGFVYGIETTRIQPEIEYEINPSLKAKTYLNYRNVNLRGGKDGGRGQIGEDLFNERAVAGLDGDSFISLGLSLTHDTRNQRENSTQGGRQSFGISYHEGLNSSEARFMRYSADMSHYFKLGSERRVLAVHFYGEHNAEMGGGHIPFYELSKLGGYGRSFHMSHTLRGFDYNRFTDETLLAFNIEYRYNIWEYRFLKVDTVLFWDEGQVFDEWSGFQFKDFRESYGLGFRLSAANVPLLSVEMAHGDEGTKFYVKSRLPF